MALNCPSPATIMAFAMTMTMTACATGDAGSKPLPVTTIAATCARPVDTLIVMLPGAYDDGAGFVKYGFVDTVRSHGIAADIAIVDASVATYQFGSVADRIAADVIEPARARGIRHIWFAGISIGGLGSLITTNEKRGLVDGMLLIAPYLGERTIAAEVAASGGLARWSPPGTISSDDSDRRIWRWLQILTNQPMDTTLPKLYLGYGVDDRYASAHRQLAEALPPDHVFTAPGGHDWPAWVAVWTAMLDRAPLPRDASCIRQGRSQ
jgi:hypothetical protein